MGVSKKDFIRLSKSMVDLNFMDSATALDCPALIPVSYTHLHNEYKYLYIAAWFYKKAGGYIFCLRRCSLMGETDYNARLYDKMKAEQDKYLSLIHIEMCIRDRYCFTLAQQGVPVPYGRLFHLRCFSGPVSYTHLWKAVTMLKERKVHCLRRSILPLMIMSYWLVACVSLQTDIISVRLQLSLIHI